MIRKTLLLGLIALAVLAAAAPALTGFYLAREFDDMVARLERPGVTEVVSSRFTRGWFRSTATIRLRLADALCQRDPCPAVTLDTVIHHGPIPFTAPVDPDAGLQPALGVAVTRIDPASLWPRLVFEPGLEPLRLITRVAFDGRADSRIAADGASVDVSRERTLAHVDTSAVSGDLELPLRDVGRLEGALDWSRFNIVGENGGQLEWRQLGIRLGRGDSGRELAGQLRAESLSLADGLGTSLLAQGLVWQVQPLPADGAGVSAGFDGRISRLVFDNAEYGPLILQGQVKNLAPSAWRALQAQLSGLRDAESGALDPEALAELYGETLPQLLAGGPGIHIDRLLLSTPDGDISGHLQVSAPEKPRPARLLADVLSQLNVDFEGQVPAPLARDLAIQVMLSNGRRPSAIEEADVTRALDELVARGLIERVDGAAAYRLRLRIDKGRLELNGRNQIGWQSVVDQFEAARERL